MAVALIFLSENNPIPHWNGSNLTIAQNIKFVMASAAKAELDIFFITTHKLLPIYQTLIEMGYPQSPHARSIGQYYSSRGRK